MQKFRDYAHENQLALWAGLLPSNASPTDTDFKTFKHAFKRVNDRVFGPRPGVHCLGVIERNVDGDCVGSLHCHLLLALEPAYQDEAARRVLRAELRRAWCETHVTLFGNELSEPEMTFNRPHSENAKELIGYFGKRYTREGQYLAKWGIPANFSWLVSANLPALWSNRDNLPSRWRIRDADPVRWLEEQTKQNAAA